MSLDSIFSLGQSALELGLITSLTVLALFLSYSMLNVCDLSTDGCFTLGATVGAVVAIAGHPYLSIAAAMAAGIASGFITAILQTKMGINSLLAGYLQDTFNLIWSCGIQILLFVAGLQTIPEQLYEVGKVEGITAWEKFWYITVPMMGRVILLVIFYTMVELFMEKGTLVNRAVTTLMEQNYTTSSAMLWPYFALVGIIIGLVVFLYNRWCLRRWE